jgi:transcriptional regulator of arginine metabolism
MKDDRQRAIHEIVRQRPVHTQQELANALAQRGLGATQATVSRDIQELGLIRTADGYRAFAPLSVVSEMVLSTTRVQFLVVIHTSPGTANVVARAIDEAALNGVAGTVAGDDTLIVVLGDDAAADELRRFLGVDS